MANVIFDTSLYIFHSFAYPDALEVWDENATEDNVILLSTIQIAELLSYHKLDSNLKLKEQREKYISLADAVIDVDIQIANKAAEIKRAWKAQTGKSLKLPDALIAATAIVHDAKLFSHNDKDFAFLKEHHNLAYINPIQNNDDLIDYIKEIKRMNF